jgi:hypothetical protein
MLVRNDRNLIQQVSWKMGMDFHVREKRRNGAGWHFMKESSEPLPSVLLSFILPHYPLMQTRMS